MSRTYPSHYCPYWLHRIDRTNLEYHEPKYLSTQMSYWEDIIAIIITGTTYNMDILKHEFLKARDIPYYCYIETWISKSQRYPLLLLY